MENILAIFLCKKFLISILSVLNSATYNKNVLGTYYVTDTGEIAVSKADRKKKIPVFMGFIIWWGD